MWGWWLICPAYCLHSRWAGGRGCVLGEGFAHCCMCRQSFGFPGDKAGRELKIARPKELFFMIRILDKSSFYLLASSGQQQGSWAGSTHCRSQSHGANFPTTVLLNCHGPVKSLTPCTCLSPHPVLQGPVPCVCCSSLHLQHPGQRDGLVS